MSSYQMYVASVPPYTQKNLNQLLEFVTKHKKVSISSIGKTVEGRPLEIIRVGNPDAPYRIFIRARAHGFEAGETGWSKA
jgi:murein tripeptide amidase MpaA